MSAIAAAEQSFPAGGAELTSEGIRQADLQDFLGVDLQGPARFYAVEERHQRAAASAQRRLSKFVLQKLKQEEYDIGKEIVNKHRRWDWVHPSADWTICLCARRYWRGGRLASYRHQHPGFY
ncbi:MAG: hypothetical protein ACYDC1_24145, partial [Limisphaerales bacterium]